MSVQNQSLRAMWLASLLACALAACDGAPAVNVGSGADGSVESPRDSGTTPPQTDAGTGSDDAGTVDSGTCPGSDTCADADAGTGTGSDAGT
ncbi:MAG TPA: hypothetical protein VE057_20760, partial [Archangium sp.]|nr:hypothetical protein [Archangium sp.]